MPTVPKALEPQQRARQRCLVAVLLMAPFAILTLLGVLFSTETIDLLTGAISNSNGTDSNTTTPPLTASNTVPPNEIDDNPSVPTDLSSTFPPLEQATAPPIPNDVAVAPSSTFPPVETAPPSTSVPIDSPTETGTATTAADVASVLGLIFNNVPTPSDTTTFPPLPTPSSPTSILDYLTLRPTGTVTDRPTRAPFSPFEFDRNKRFRLKMHWELEYFWQEEVRETFWCIACTTCNALNFGAQGQGCRRTDRCSQGDQIWLQPCQGDDPYNGDAFSFVNVGDEYHQIRNPRTNLCLERTLTRYVTLEPCGDPLRTVPMRQLWFGMRDDGEPFEIRPALDSNDPEPFCLTQQHHPKNFEIVALKECQWAHFYDTGLWGQYKL